MATRALLILSAWLCLLPAAEAFDHDHRDLTALLQAHVAEGRVDYAALAARPAGLADYLESLNAVSAEDIAGWDDAQQLAFWINAYNALAIDTIVAHYPLKRRGLRGFAFPRSSIQQIDAVWTLKRRVIGGERRSLDDIEHGIIRANFNEPRIHFALVCAAVSCPELRAEAYRAAELDTQLQEQLTGFLANATKGLRIDPRRRRISISAIFKWFPEDFPLPPAVDGELAGKTEQAGVVHFISRAAPAAAGTALRSRDFRVDYLPYDWALNEQ